MGKKQSNHKAASLVWFRQDLRLPDNAALARAIESGRPLVPVYIHAPQEEGDWAPGGAGKWWLHHALEDLEARLREHGLRLILRRAKTSTLETLLELARETNAGGVFWNRRYEPAAIKRDGKIKTALKEEGLEAVSANSCLLFEPHEIENKSGKPFQVFTPFWKHCSALQVPAVAEVDLEALQGPKKWPKSEPLDSWKLLPSIAWDKGIRDSWDPTAAGGRDRLKGFIRQGALEYSDLRDHPGLDATTRLSPYLHWGQIGPREIWEAFTRSKNFGPAVEKGILRQIIWREFAHHLLYHFPETPTKPLREEFELFPWDTDERLLEKWRRGETGYPIVDAGMRQLWETGWMHNRVRMVAASFLVKHLLQHWLDGAQWFWDTLVDADLANNTFGWQWTAGCGADAAPYFRVFNPITQGKKFDLDGEYVRQYVPELARLPDKFLFSPWDAPREVLAEAGVVLGKSYPEPVIEHAAGRARALEAFEKLKAARASER